MHHIDHTTRPLQQRQHLYSSADSSSQKNQTVNFAAQVGGAAAPAAYSPHLTNGYPPAGQGPYGSVAQDQSYYASHPSPISSTSASGTYNTSEAKDPMATAHMQQRPYQSMYHTPQSNSPASVASPQGHDQHGRSMYGQPPPPLTAPMYGYPQYSPMSQVHNSTYSHPAPPQHPQLTSQPMLMHPTGQPQMPHPQVQHSSGMTSSPRMKLESSQQHQHQHQQPPPSARLPMTQPQPSTPVTAASGKMDYNQRPDQSAHATTNNSSAPGPIPATTPLVVKQDGNGVQWIAFEYSRDRVKLEYTIRCDVESVNVEELSPEFKSENCVYPRACCRKEDYRGNRLNYETECNAVGWALAELNQCLRGKRGLIQRAVDSWRNSNQDVRLRSRRVRRQAKMNTRKNTVPAGPMSAGSMPGSAGIPGPNSGMRTPTGPAPGQMGLGPQLHHHHAHPDGTDGRQDDVSGNTNYPTSSQAPRQQAPYQVPPADLRYGHNFHGYPAYPTAPTGEPSMAPPMHHGLDSLGRSVGTAAVVSTNDKDDDEDARTAMFGDLPEGKRRKFILVEDNENGKRVRVKVMLDQVNMKEIPDSYRKQNSVFPRSYTATEAPDTEPDVSRNRRYFADETSEDDGEAIVSRTLVPVPLPGGDGEVAVPRISHSKHKKEETLNDLAYRMSWSQSRTFNQRHLFLQRSLDAYRKKMRDTMVTAGQEEETVAPHFELRPGKRRWNDWEKKTRSDSPADVQSSQ